MFDITKAIKKSGLSKTEVANLKKEIKKEYPRDEMLYELHLMRALNPRIGRPSSRKTVKSH